MHFLGFSERVFILHGSAAAAVFDIKFSWNCINCSADTSQFILHSYSLQVFCFSPEDQPILLLGLFFINLVIPTTNDSTADLKTWKRFCRRLLWPVSSCLHLSGSLFAQMGLDEVQKPTFLIMKHGPKSNCSQHREYFYLKAMLFFYFWQWILWLVSKALIFFTQQRSSTERGIYGSLLRTFSVSVALLKRQSSWTDRSC